MMSIGRFPAILSFQICLLDIGCGECRRPWKLALRCSRRATGLPLPRDPLIIDRLNRSFRTLEWIMRYHRGADPHREPALAEKPEETAMPRQPALNVPMSLAVIRAVENALNDRVWRM
jgi:hypothetical protein